MVLTKVQKNRPVEENTGSSNELMPFVDTRCVNKLTLQGSGEKNGLFNSWSCSLTTSLAAFPDRTASQPRWPLCCSLDTGARSSLRAACCCFLARNGLPLDICMASFGSVLESQFLGEAFPLKRGKFEIQFPVIC